MTSQKISKKIEALETRLADQIGPRGGKIIGKTRSGKDIYESADHPAHKDFKKEDHFDASKAHEHAINEIKKNPHHHGPMVFEQMKHHKQQAQKHDEKTGLGFRDPVVQPQSKAASVAVEKLLARLTVK